MPKFVPIWGPKPPSVIRRGVPRPAPGAASATTPGAATAATDGESGTDDAGDLRRSLDALDVMHRRGLIGDAEYAERRRDLLGSVAKG